MSVPWPTNSPSSFDFVKPYLHCLMRSEYAKGAVKQPTGKDIKVKLPMLAKVLARDINNQANIFWRGLKGDSDSIADSNQSSFDSYPADIKTVFGGDDLTRPDKKPRIPSTPIIFGGKRPSSSPPCPSKNMTPTQSKVEAIHSAVEADTNSENRLQMHHITHYLDHQTLKHHTIVIFTLFPGTDITQEISKDGFEILFHIRSPNRLTAKMFANKKKYDHEDYDVDDDDQRQCLMSYFKAYTPLEYVYKVELPLPVITHPDCFENWWVNNNGAESLVLDFIQQCDDDYRFEIQSSYTPKNIFSSRQSA